MSLSWFNQANFYQSWQEIFNDFRHYSAGISKNLQNNFIEEIQLNPLENLREHSGNLLEYCCSQKNLVFFPDTQDRFQLTLFDEIDSTNRIATELLRQHQPGTPYPLILAQTQTAGRGQWGRSWQSHPGGLFLSLGWKIPIPTYSEGNQRLGLLPLGAAWGVAQGLRQRGIAVQLKWPNDLLLCGKKLGGILIEIYPMGLVMGVGINWENEPPEPGIALKTYQLHHNLMGVKNLETLAAIVTVGLLTGIGRWCNPLTPIEHCIADYEALFAQRGQWVPVGADMGQVLGITTTGALRLEVNGREHHGAIGEFRLGY